MKVFFAAIPLFLLVACQAPASDPSPASSQSAQSSASSSGDNCGAASRQNLVGTPLADFDQSALPEGSRVLHPTTPMTRDYRTDRLNVYVDDDGNISRVSCG